LTNGLNKFRTGKLLNQRKRSIYEDTVGILSAELLKTNEEISAKSAEQKSFHSLKKPDSLSKNARELHFLFITYVELKPADT